MVYTHFFLKGWAAAVVKENLCEQHVLSSNETLMWIRGLSWDLTGFGKKKKGHKMPRLCLWIRSLWCFERTQLESERSTNCYQIQCLNGTFQWLCLYNLQWMKIIILIYARTVSWTHPPPLFFPPSTHKLCFLLVGSAHHSRLMWLLGTSADFTNALWFLAVLCF